MEKWLVPKKKKVALIPWAVWQLGKISLALEFEEILVVDAGLMLPEEEMLGIGCVIPDIPFSWKKEDPEVVLTHGHEGHIGAHLSLRDWRCLFMERLTMGLVQSKLLKRI